MNFSKYDCNSSIEESVLVVATGILFSNRVFCVVNLSYDIIDEFGKQVFCLSSVSSEITNDSEEGWGWIKSIEFSDMIFLINGMNLGSECFGVFILISTSGNSRWYWLKSVPTIKNFSFVTLSALTKFTPPIPPEPVTSIFFIICYLKRPKYVKLMNYTKVF